MSINHTISFGFSEDDSVNLESVKKMFKSRMIEENISLEDLSTHGMYVMKAISKNFGNSTLDKVFKKSIESLSQKHQTNQGEYLELCIFGFKATTHLRFLKTVEQKLSVKMKKHDYRNFELVIPNVKIPYVKNKVFPALTIQAQSSTKELKIKLMGQSAMIFVLFQLKKCLELFMKNLPGTLSQCYEEEESTTTTTTTTDSSDTESSDGPPKSKKKYKRIVIHTSSDESVVKMANHDDTDDKSEEMKESEHISHDDNNDTMTYIESPILKSRFREKKEEEDDQCMGCAMYYVSKNIFAMVANDNMHLSLKCTEECFNLDEDKLDAMDDMALSIYTLISRGDELNRNTINNFCMNFEMICKMILDNTEGGREGFYVQMLRDLSRMKVTDADKVVTVMNEVIDICIKNRKNFERKIMNNKTARRNLFSYIKSTGAFFSVISVIESWYKMFLQKVDLTLIFPSKLKFILDIFKSLGATDSGQVHHENMSNVARKVIEILHANKIQPIELNRKQYKINETGRTISLKDDLYIYLIKEHNSILVFLFYKGLTIAKNLDLEKAIFEEEGNNLVTDEWIFELKSAPDKELFKLATNLSLKQSENEKEKSENITNQSVDVPESPKLYEIVDNEEQNTDDDDNDDEIRVDKDSDKIKHCVINTAFKLEKYKIFDYWPENQQVGQKRKFISSKIGIEWPRLYGGVCPIVIESNYVTIYSSRKRNANFGKVVAKCVICNAKHTFTIKDNPFEEALEDGTIKYKAVEDMIIDVKVEGDFLVENGSPCLNQPAHLKSKARGLHLKGQERVLLGDLAVQQGVQSAYKQQMAFLLEDEIKVGNTTAMRSLPVIKMAKQEQEKKQRGGATFYESARNVYLGQDADVSPDFPDLASAKLLPGMVRSLQEFPFKITLANFEMLRVGAKYFSGGEDTTVYIDSSGKYWQEKRKSGANLLNTALVLPPLSEGLSPFPIYEMISQTNKTQDFIEMLQQAWNNMAMANSNRSVPVPTFAVSDLSFPNLHALLMVFNKTKLHEYLSSSYNSLMKGEAIPHNTIVTICVNHLLPAILKTSRAQTQEKMIVDTVVAGFMLVLR